MVLYVLAELISVLVRVILAIILAPIKFFIPKSRKDVAGEVVLITGGGMGMGRLLAIEFAKLNASVVIWDVNQEAMNSVVEEIKSLGKHKQVFSYVVDISKREQVSEAADRVRLDVGDVSMLFNNAGIVSGSKLLSVSDEKIQLVMDVNTTSHFWTLKAFLPSMLTQNHGHVVTVASSAGIFGVNGMLDYCASKFAAVGLHESLTMELYAQGKDGVNTTLVCPYLVHTGMFKGAGGRFDWLVPPMTPEYAVNRIMNAVLSNDQLLLMPRILYVFWFLQTVMPKKATFILADFTGITRFMDRFVGRSNAAKKAE